MITQYQPGTGLNYSVATYAILLGQTIVTALVSHYLSSLRGLAVDLSRTGNPKYRYHPKLATTTHGDADRKEQAGVFNVYLCKNQEASLHVGAITWKDNLSSIY